LKKAETLKPADSVVYYHLARVHQALGNSAEQQKSRAVFRRRRAAASELHEAAFNPPSARPATKQELDPDVR
jgi:hypothetical protein